MLYLLSGLQIYADVDTGFYILEEFFCELGAESGKRTVANFIVAIQETIIHFEYFKYKYFESI